jgi:hypothetical protein
VQLTATATFSDGSTYDVPPLVTWSSTAGLAVSSAAGAPGLARALAAGTSTVTATYAGLFSSVSGSTSLTVAPAP